MATELGDHLIYFKIIFIKFKFIIIKTFFYKMKTEIYSILNDFFRHKDKVIFYF